MSPWWLTKDGDLDCLDLYRRHYSAEKSAGCRTGELFVGPGNKLVLRTECGNAVFVWRKFTDDCIDDRTGERQQGINCAVFRNESEHLSSFLIRQADRIADEVWTDRRHYTYVNTKGGLLIMERVTLDAALATETPQARGEG